MPRVPHVVPDHDTKKGKGHMQTKPQHKGSAGRLPEDRIRPMPAPIDPALLDRFERLEDLTGPVSDVLDRLGRVGVVGSSILKPTLPQERVIGRAITVRNIPQSRSVQQTIADGANMMTEIEGIHQAEPGDVLVIQGLRDMSNMGGVMATTCFYKGLAGAVVDGGIRDVGESRGLGFPVWSRDISPISGKWRAETREINGPVKIHGVPVAAGDLVIADETGVCFVPRDLIEQVLEACEAIARTEQGWVEGLKNGMTVPELVAQLFK